MDFIEQLPKSHGKDVILVVICIFTKYAHFQPLQTLLLSLDSGKAVFGVCD